MRMGDLISRVEAIDAIYDSMLYGEAYKGVCARAIQHLPAVDAVEVVHCAECVYCQKYNEWGDFYCQRTDTDFYSPAYDAATYYCADGTRRSDGG